MTANPDLAAQNNNQTHVEFSTVQSNLTLEILNNKQKFSKLLKSELKAFVRIRSQRTLRRSTINFKDVPDKKSALLERCFDLQDTPLSSQVLKDSPIYPVLLEQPSGGDEVADNS